MTAPTTLPAIIRADELKAKGIEAPSEAAPDEFTAVLVDVPVLLIDVFETVAPPVVVVALDPPLSMTKSE